MSDRYFLDTNILIYTVGNLPSKKKIAVELLDRNAVISTQIITESVNIMHRKLGFAERYGYAYYDSQVIASALENNCGLLYSEDLQHGQIIEKRLKIMNPFRDYADF